MLPYRTTNKKLKEVHINKCIINMESNAKFKKLLLKFGRYYFDDIIKIEDLDLENYLTYENTYENILLQKISYKHLIAAKLWCIRFDKRDRHIRVYDGLTRYLVLFGSTKYDFIYSKIRYIIREKNCYICYF